MTSLPVPEVGPVLLAVDGNSLAHRAFHAYRRVPGGGHYGFLALLAGICDRVDLEGLVVGFDCRSASVRREGWPAYKAGRADKDPELDRLLDDLPRLLADLGVHVVQPHGWEADDVVGSAAAAAEGQGWRCVVATSDADALGLVTRRTTVLRMRSGLDNAEEVTPERLHADYGITAGQYVEFAALRGDVSDNLTGVHGIGQALARTLLATWPTVAEAAADPLRCVSVLPRGAGRALLADLADPASVFRRNVELMTIRRDLPIDLVASRRHAGAARIATALGAWGLAGLAGRVAVAIGVRPERSPPPEP